MHLHRLLLTLTPLLPAVTAIACVAGGPAALVSAANACCTQLGGTWNGPQAEQGICVLQDWAGFWYNLCVDEIPGGAGLLDTECIPGDGEGLTGGASTTTGLPPRVTFTRRAF